MDSSSSRPHLTATMFAPVLDPLATWGAHALGLAIVKCNNTCMNSVVAGIVIFLGQPTACPTQTSIDQLPSSAMWWDVVYRLGIDLRCDTIVLRPYRCTGIVHAAHIVTEKSDVRAGSMVVTHLLTLLQGAYSRPTLTAAARISNSNPRHFIAYCEGSFIQVDREIWKSVPINLTP